MALRRGSFRSLTFISRDTARRVPVLGFSLSDNVSNKLFVLGLPMPPVCPATPRMGQAGVIVMALVNSVGITRNAEHERILRLAWEAKFSRLLAAPMQPDPGQGKEYSSTMYGCPEAMALLAVPGP